MVSSLDNFTINMITDIINETYDSGEILEDLSRSIFIATSAALSLSLSLE